MLIRLLTSNITFHKFTTSSIFRNPSIVRENLKELFKTRKSLFLKPKKIPLTFAAFAGASFVIRNGFSIANCDVSRNSDLRIAVQKKDDIKFEWKLFWSYLSKHIYKLLGAIAAALAVAYLNISIPSLLGDLINLLSKYAGEMHGTARDFLSVSRIRFDFRKLFNQCLQIVGC